jgi:hypothetical protein
MPKHQDRATHWEWKSRECRVAARHMRDPAGRLALLELARIYQGLAKQAKQPEEPGSTDGPTTRKEPAAPLRVAAD